MNRNEYAQRAIVYLCAQPFHVDNTKEKIQNLPSYALAMSHMFLYKLWDISHTRFPKSPCLTKMQQVDNIIKNHVKASKLVSLHWRIPSDNSDYPWPLGDRFMCRPPMWWWLCNAPEHIIMVPCCGPPPMLVNLESKNSTKELVSAILRVPKRLAGDTFRVASLEPINDAMPQQWHSR